MTSWSNLPAELRLAILQIVADTSMGHIATYASVCSEWQEVFEAKSFERIVLSQRRVLEFAQIVQGPRRRLVKHIWLRIELSDDDHSSYKTISLREMDFEGRDNFVGVIKVLFTTLSAWERPRDLNKEGLTLEFCAYSPSDSEHMPKDRDFAHDPYSEPAEEISALPNPREHPAPTQLDRDNLFRNIFRLTKSYVSIMWFNNDYESAVLPEVNVVTSFLIRRQYYRKFDPNDMYYILVNLTGLESIIYEPQREWITSQSESDICYCRLFEYMLPPSLKRLTVFENYEEELAAVIAAPGESGRVRSPEVSQALMRRSQALEHLSAAFIIDAMDFLRPFWPPASQPIPWSWAKLKTIALTSQVLKPDSNRDLISYLCEAAGLAARNMPNLEIMEIWNGDGDKHGSIFRFCNEEMVSTITWQSNWEMKLAEWVLSSWRITVYETRHHNNLSVRYANLPMDGTRFPASVLPHLKLKDQVLHPVSFRQIQLIGTSRNK
ncbi:uncharacterized protein F4822DRAFT_398509 [Hypoxylon trugodes]|uniref:uncharacterized protein n=1 Tax=Hypoxylon trugodes TaxID=326681 RepID=UPI002193C0E3|nr:uncharacterized protein F4822DRAFT_398509 [Hypoxylon trugodes]KAI1389493.1 hypothetical protein F4822DRAFT_398509 [Hypoxylon trugodes]